VRQRLAVPTLLAIAVAVAYGWSELTGYLWTDYDLFNRGPLWSLVHGHLGDFFQTAPVEGPSLLLRSPFAMAAWLWGGSDLAVYRMVAVPGLLAGVVLAVTLWELRARRYPGAPWGLLVVALVVGNPLMLQALAIGHPEEMLGAALCVGAVLAALYKRPWLAAVLLGLALGQKAWAVLAIGPVLMAVDRRRWSVLALASGIAALLVAPFLLAESSRGTMVTAGGTFDMFQPWQLWWPLGDHGDAIRGFFGVAKEGYRVAPSWIGHVTHPLIAFLVVPGTLLWRRRHGPGPASADVLLLLSLLFLARCVLDAANNSYYHLPFLIALAAWEALQRKRPPVLSVAAAGLVWLTVVKLPDYISPDAQCAAYLVWALPALAALAYATYRKPYATRRSASTATSATSTPATA
jgi:hypothetical protein